MEKKYLLKTNLPMGPLVTITSLAFYVPLLPAATFMCMRGIGNHYLRFAGGAVMGGSALVVRCGGRSRSGAVGRVHQVEQPRGNEAHWLEQPHAAAEGKHDHHSYSREAIAPLPMAAATHGCLGRQGKKRGRRIVHRGISLLSMLFLPLFSPEIIK